jgi:WD40 repeat protein
MLKLFLASLITLSLFAKMDATLPTYSLTASGDVQDIVFHQDKLYAATSEGVVDIFDTLTKERIQAISIPDIKDFMGDSVSSKLYSVDLLNNKLLIVSQGMKGYRNLWLYSGTLKKIVGIDKKLFIKEARFVSDDAVILATLSNQIILYDIKTGQEMYNIQISASSFSDLSLSEDKKQIISTDESGIVRRIDTLSGSVVSVIGKENLDRVYQLDHKNGVTLTAGQDRKSVVYQNGGSDALDFHFLLYSCGLSPSGKVAGVAFNEENEVLIFDTKTMSKRAVLGANRATLTKILFISETELFVTSDSSKINFYKLGE